MLGYTPVSNKYFFLICCFGLPLHIPPFLRTSNKIDYYSKIFHSIQFITAIETFVRPVLENLDNLDKTLNTEGMTGIICKILQLQ